MARRVKMAVYAVVSSSPHEYGEVRRCQTSTHLYGINQMARKKPTKITVLLSDEEFDRFDRYCQERGFKKSTLIARLIRQYLDLEGYGMSNNVFARGPRGGGR
jgi:hypothetical protein